MAHTARLRIWLAAPAVLAVLGAIWVWRLAVDGPSPAAPQVPAGGTHAPAASPDAALAPVEPSPPAIANTPGSSARDARVQLAATVAEAPAGEATAPAPDLPDLIVQTVAEDGTPLPGIAVQVATRRADSGGHAGQWSAIESAESAGEDALATFRSLREKWSDPAHSAWRIETRTLMPDPPTLPLDPEHWPTDTVQLVVPACGSVAVEVTGATATERVALAVVRDAQGKRLGRKVQPVLWSAVSNGEARFDRVGLGLGLEARGQAPEDGGAPAAVAAVEGPRAAGESVRVLLDLGVNNTRVSGRLLDRSGTPLARAGIDVGYETSLDGMWSRSRGRLTTDPEGRFEYTIRRVRLKGTEVALEFSHLTELGQELAAAIGLPPVFTEPTFDAGDVTLQPVPVFAAGIVVDETGSSVPGVPLVVLVGQDVGPPLTEASGAPTMSGPDGRFAIKREIDGHDFALTIGMSAYLAPAPLPFVPGQRDIVLRVARCGEIAGRAGFPFAVNASAYELLAWRGELRFPPAVDSSLGHSAWQSGDGPSMRYFHASPDHPELADTVASNPESNGDFRILRLPSGSYALRLASPDGRSIWERDGISVAAGETTDLGLIDLSELLVPMHVEIVDPNGELVPSGHVAALALEAEDEKPTWLRFARGRADLAVAPGPVDLLVSAPGFCTARQEGVRGDQRVVLVPGAPVTIEMAPDAVLPAAPLRLGVSLAPEDPTALPLPEDPQAKLDRRGRAQFILPPGTYVVHWRVSKDTSSSETTHGRGSNPEQTITVLDTPDAQSFQLTLEDYELNSLVEGF